MRDRFGLGQMRITRGALILAIGEIGLSLVYLLSDGTHAGFNDWLVASHSNVFERGRVWTLVTSNFIQPNFIALILHAIMLWGFFPTLERFWGTHRFLRFAAITSLVGTAAGTASGYVTGVDAVMTGLDPFFWAGIVAFGIVYARQNVQFFGVLPLTGRQMMYGFLGFLTLQIVLTQAWDHGIGYGLAMATGAILVSRKWSPALAWKKWRIARARAKLSVIQGGATKKAAGTKRDEQRFIN